MAARNIPIPEPYLLAHYGRAVVLGLIGASVALSRVH